MVTLVTNGFTVSIKRSRRPDVFCAKGVLRNFKKFTRKHLCLSLFFNKVAGLRSATLLKKRLWHRCFPVNFVKFIRTPFLQNTSGGCFCINNSKVKSNTNRLNLVDMRPQLNVHKTFIVHLKRYMNKLITLNLNSAISRYSI